MAVATRSIALLFVASYIARVPVTAISLALILVLRESGRGYDLAGLAPAPTSSGCRSPRR